MYTLFGARGSGSVITESMFIWAGLPFKLEEFAFEELGRKNQRLTPYNPLGQVPTLLLPNGSVLTESAAITFHISDIKPGLVPPVGDAQRDAFLRWLLFLVSSLYPSFLYGDFPALWVKDEDSQRQLVESTDQHRCELWQYLETQVGEPWFLGETFSALDIYLAVMTFWRPGLGWFKRSCPKLHTIAKATRALAPLQPIFVRHFAPKP